jgi:GTP 3',8-cyclase
MIAYRKYTSLRLKLLEACQLRCRFCHHEGNAGARHVDPVEAVAVARRLRDELGLDKVHLTGGEPTLYPALFELLDALAGHGFRTALTSHGLFPSRIRQELCRRLADGRLEYVNLSMHTDEPSRYLALHGRPPTATARREAAQDLETIRDNAVALAAVGAVRINCVVSDDEADVRTLFRFATRYGTDLRLVPDWTAQRAARRTIARFLANHDARFLRFLVVHPTSNYSAQYLVGGSEVSVKLIRPVGLRSLCDGCPERPRCTEFFGNLRLEGRPLHVRVCIHRQGAPPVQPVAAFLDSPQCRELRERLRTAPLDIESEGGLEEPFGILDRVPLENSGPRNRGEGRGDEYRHALELVD